MPNIEIQQENLKKKVKKFKLLRKRLRKKDKLRKKLQKANSVVYEQDFLIGEKVILDMDVFSVTIAANLNG